MRPIHPHGSGVCASRSATFFRAAFDHQLGERSRVSNSDQTPAKQVIHHRSFIVASVRGPKRLINFVRRCMRHAACEIERRLADSNEAMSSARRRSYASHFGQFPSASIHSGCCASKSRCSCSFNSAYVRTWRRFLRLFNKLSCSPIAFTMAVSLSPQASASARWKDFWVQPEGGCALSLLGDTRAGVTHRSLA